MQEAPRMPPLPGIKTILDGERYIEKVNPLDVDGAELRLQQRVVGVHKVSISRNLNVRCILNYFHFCTLECTKKNVIYIMNNNIDYFRRFQRGSGASVELEGRLIDPETGQIFYKFMSGAFLLGAKNFKDSGMQIIFRTIIQILFSL